jgi:RND family efflux transporter MFP subunit
MRMPEPGNRGYRWGGLMAAMALASVVGIGIAGRARNEKRVAAWTREQAAPRVAVVHPAPIAPNAELRLPSTLQALNSAPLYARTTGYLRRWLVDLGDPVRKGQLLAELDAPELDQQLIAARAELQTAQANQQLAKSTAARWGDLLAQELISKQTMDEKLGDLTAKTAAADAASANVARLQSMAGFTRIEAPFDGVVTSRSAQIGSLVVAGGAASAPLFTVADVTRIRVFVRVPQVYSPRIRPGLTAGLELPEMPGRTFVATVTRTAGAIDSPSGTLLTELQADNPERALKPGAFAQARFSLASPGNTVTLPPSAFIFGEAGTQVALVEAGDTVALRKVALGRDLGQAVEVTSGLTAGDAVIDSPPDSLAAGDAVVVVSGSTGPAASKP